jgi:hypothetical protein
VEIFLFILVILMFVYGVGHKDGGDDARTFRIKKE